MVSPEEVSRDICFVYLALTEAEMEVLKFIEWCCQRAVELAPVINVH